MSKSRNIGHSVRSAPYSLAQRPRFGLTAAVNLVKSVVPDWLARLWRRSDSNEQNESTQAETVVTKGNSVSPEAKEMVSAPDVRPRLPESAACSAGSEVCNKQQVRRDNRESTSQWIGISNDQLDSRKSARVEVEVRPNRKREHSQNDDDSTSGISSNNDVDAAVGSFDATRTSRFSQFLASSNANLSVNGSQGKRTDVSVSSVHSTWSQSKRARYLELAPIGLRSQVERDGHSNGTGSQLFSERYRLALAVNETRSAASFTQSRTDSRLAALLDARLATSFGPQSSNTSSSATLGRRSSRPTFDPETVSMDYLTPLLAAAQSNANSVLSKFKSGANSSLFYTPSYSKPLGSPFAGQFSTSHVPLADLAWPSSNQRRLHTPVSNSRPISLTASPLSSPLKSANVNPFGHNSSITQAASFSGRSTAKVILDRLNELDTVRRRQSIIDATNVTSVSSVACSTPLRGTSDNRTNGNEARGSERSLLETNVNGSAQFKVPNAIESTRTSFETSKAADGASRLAFSFSSPISCGRLSFTSNALSEPRPSTANANSNSNLNASSNTSQSDSSPLACNFGVPRKSNGCGLGFAFTFAPPLELEMVSSVNARRDEPGCN